MRIHKEGRVTLLIIAVLIVLVNYLVIKLSRNEYLIYSFVALSAFLYLFTMYFFRFVHRPLIVDDKLIISPADGKIVVIDDVEEPEYPEKKCKQVSIFMSVYDVHSNWFPVSGKIIRAEHQKGNHYVAWAAKSSEFNERATTTIETDNGATVLVRQIAGAMARRVVCYALKMKYGEQGEHLGFIKFGSRVDLFLPKEAEIKIGLNQKVKGNQTVIAKL